jgi:hypothetical protein
VQAATRDEPRRKFLTQSQVTFLQGFQRRFFDSPARVWLAFCFLTVFMTWPLAAHVTSYLPEGAGDLWQNLWNFWWWKRALIDLHQSPYRTDYLFFPFGAKIVFHTHSEINQLAGLPVSLLFGPLAAYNVVLLVGLTLAGLGAYLLARELTGDGPAAFLAGLIFAFFPHHFEQMLEHLNLATVQFLPFMSLYFLRTVRQGGGRNVLLFGIFFALNALGCWHYCLMGVLLLAVLLVGELALGADQEARSLARLAGRLTIAAVVAVVLMAPFLWPLVNAAASGDPYLKAFVNRGVDVVFLFLPSDHHPLLGWLTRNYYHTHRAYYPAGFLAYIGFTPLFLALAAVPAVRQDRRLRTWFVVAVAFLVLALGAHPLVGGTRLPVAFPHLLFRGLPLLRALRVANRFIVITMLALAVLAACGAARLARVKQWRFLTPLAAAMILFEYLWLPFPVQRVDFPSYLTVLASDPQAGAVLDIPFCTRALPGCALNQAFQTVHGRPIAGGYLSVTPKDARDAVRQDPVLRKLIGFTPTVPRSIDIAHLRNLGFGTVILHKDRTQEFFKEQLVAMEKTASIYRARGFLLHPGIPQEKFQTISDRFEAALGPPIFEDDRIRVFRIS